MPPLVKKLLYVLLKHDDFIGALHLYYTNKKGVDHYWTITKIRKYKHYFIRILCAINT